jgi:hypothetical protein
MQALILGLNIRKTVLRCLQAVGMRHLSQMLPGQRTTANPVFDLSFNPEEVKRRLSGVPVFAVVNSKNEFVLVSGEDGDSTSAHQLGFFFFNREDAEALITTVRSIQCVLANGVLSII